MPWWDTTDLAACFVAWWRCTWGEHEINWIPWIFMNVALADRTAYYVHIMYLASSVFEILAKFGLIRTWWEIFQDMPMVYIQEVSTFSRTVNSATFRLHVLDIKVHCYPRNALSIEAHLQTSCVTAGINILRTDLNFSTLSSTLILYTTPYTSASLSGRKMPLFLKNLSWS